MEALSSGTDTRNQKPQPNYNDQMIKLPRQSHAPSTVCFPLAYHLARGPVWCGLVWLSFCHITSFHTSQ